MKYCNYKRYNKNYNNKLNYRWYKRIKKVIEQIDNFSKEDLLLFKNIKKASMSDWLELVGLLSGVSVMSLIIFESKSDFILDLMLDIID